MIISMKYHIICNNFKLNLHYNMLSLADGKNAAGTITYFLSKHIHKLNSKILFMCYNI